VPTNGRIHADESAEASPQDRTKCLFVAEAVDQADVDALAVLDRAAEGRAEVHGRESRREVGIEVVVDIDSGSKGAGRARRPETEVGGGEALGTVIELTNGRAAFDEAADLVLLLHDEAILGAGHEGVLGNLRIELNELVITDLGVAEGTVNVSRNAELAAEEVGRVRPEGDLAVLLQSFSGLEAKISSAAASLPTVAVGLVDGALDAVPAILIALTPDAARALGLGREGDGQRYEGERGGDGRGPECPGAS